MPSLDSVPGAGVLLNDEGIIIDWNDRCRVVFGDALAGCGGAHLNVLAEAGVLDDAALSCWIDAVERASSNRTDTARELTLQTVPDGGNRQYDLIAAPVKNEPGRVVCTLRSVGTSSRYAETLTALHAATRDLMTAETTEAVFERTAKAADEVLGFPGTGVRKYDPESGLLHHVSFGARVGDIDSRPPYPIDESPHGRALRRGETIIEDIDDDDPYDRDPFSQTMYVPIGDDGLLSTGITSGTFDETDTQFAEILAENAAAAIITAETRASLRKERERLDLLKRIFSRVLRHNIRNDVNVIRGNANRLDRDDGVVETICARTENILRLSEKARDIERILEVPQDRRPVDVAATVEAAIDSVQDDYPDASIRTEIHDSGPVLAYDTLTIAVENLVENACQHTESDEPAVRVRSQSAGDRVEVTVIDDGPGIDRQEIEVLKSGQETALWHGSGLGLWLVKLAVETAGATIEFETGPTGTTVRMMLDRALEDRDDRST